MDRDTVISYLRDADGIEFVSDLAPTRMGAEDFPLHLMMCNLFVNGNAVAIKLLITKWFPRQLPIFFLEKYDALGFLPHIEPRGNICFLEKESIYINEEEPRVVFEASVELAIQTLSDGLSKANWQDFREEFQVFWERNQSVSSLPLSSFIKVIEEPKIIQIVKDQKKAMAFDLENAELQKRIHFKDGKGLTKTGIYIPLTIDCEIIPPKYTRSWTGDEFVDWLNPKISEEHWALLRDSILNKRANRFEYLLIGIPRNTGATILVGGHLKSKGNSKHPLVTPNSGWGFTMHSVKRLDPSAFLPRGGAKTLLQEKAVLLVGCGSVGSHFAIELAKAGVGKIHLVDNDKIELENVQRYALGFQYVGVHKVTAIKEFLNSNYWLSQVESYEVSLENFLDIENLDLGKYDLIVSATGNPTINIYLNKLAREDKIPLLIGWNEPFGIGGHALLDSAEGKGCYRCLFRNQYNIASFSGKDQPKPFHRKHLGCGEVFTPYSALDSVRTSELMTRSAISFLSDRTLKSQILSWKGDKTDFENEGFIVSERYTNQTQEKMDENRFSFVQNGCPNCGKTE